MKRAWGWMLVAACASPPPQAAQPTIVTVPTAPPAASSAPATDIAPPDAAPPVDESKKSNRTACGRLAVAMAIDRSGSMMGEPIKWARAGADAAVKALTNDDCVAIVAFDSLPTAFVPLRVVDDVDAIHAGIARISAGGGTEIKPALEAAHAELSRATSARKRHVLLLTDGQAPTAGIRDVVQAMASERITVTTVGLGTGVDKDLLRMIADVGGGRFYSVADATALPRIFEREVTIASSVGREP